MGNLSIFVGKQQETNQSMRLKRNKEKRWRKVKGKVRYTREWGGIGGGMEAEGKRLITPSNYEAL